MFLLFFIIDIAQQQHDFLAFDCRDSGTVIGVIMQLVVFIPNTHFAFGIALLAVKFRVKNTSQQSFVVVQQLLIELIIKFTVTTALVQ